VLLAEISAGQGSFSAASPQENLRLELFETKIDEIAD